MQEIEHEVKWMSVIGYEGLYDVSNAGHIRNSRTGKILKPWLARSSKVLQHYAVSLYKNGKKCNKYIHRLVLESFAKNKNGDQVDHINNNSLDNRIENLRWCTHCQNNQNKGIIARNTSGYRGVSFHKQSKKWRARIWVNGKEETIGSFENPQEASEAYENRAKEVHGEFYQIGNNISNSTVNINVTNC